MRTLELKGSPASNGSAEYFVLLGAETTGVTVDSAKFVSGEDKLRGFDDALHHLKLSLTFPDETPTKILRRGVLSCPQAKGSCMFVLMLPDDVRSVD